MWLTALPTRVVLLCSIFVGMIGFSGNAGVAQVNGRTRHVGSLTSAGFSVTTEQIDAGNVAPGAKMLTFARVGAPLLSSGQSAPVGSRQNWLTSLKVATVAAPGAQSSRLGLRAPGIQPSRRELAGNLTASSRPSAAHSLALGGGGSACAARTRPTTERSAARCSVSCPPGSVGRTKRTARNT